MVLDAITSFYFGIFTFIFSPVLVLYSPLAEAIIAIILIFITTSFYKILGDQEKIKQLKVQHKELSDKAKEVQKTDPEKANKIMGEILKLTNKQMKMNMKPMFAALVVFMIFFPWLSNTFIGKVNIELFGFTLGWLKWYILLSLPASMIIRKALGVS